jgi:hypothetical protein
MTRIVLAPTNVVASPAVGGHFWVYLQYALGLRAVGCDVVWLERFQPSGDAARDAALRATFHERMARFGLAERYVLHADGPVWLNKRPDEVEELLRGADLLLNFHYAMDPALLARFRRTALVDIDPGLLQTWMATGQLRVAPHDRYLTIGETVGKPGALFPDCGFRWSCFRPPIFLDAWPNAASTAARAFTTVSGWWGGGGAGEWVTDGKGGYYENNKRVSFLQFVELPRRTTEILELALALGDDAFDEAALAKPARPPKPERARVTDYVGDAQDVARLRSHGWHVRDAREATGSPEAFQAYVQGSRGEFSCAKPSCMAFQNAWISDRTLCYLASGRPVVVQDTGPSNYLPNGPGMMRFRTLDEATAALASVTADYARHCRAARELAEACFDARVVLPRLLDAAFGRA